MRIKVNDEVRELQGGSTLLILLAELGIEARKGLAVAVNQSVVPFSKRAEYVLAEGDQVLIIEAAQGG